MRPTPRKFEKASATLAPAPAPPAPPPPPVVPPERLPLPKPKSAKESLVRPSSESLHDPAEIKVRFADGALEAPPAPFQLFDGRPRIIATLAALVLLIVPIRGAVLGWPVETIFTSVDSTPFILFCAVYDVMLTVGLGIVAYLAIWRFRFRPRPQRAICVIFTIVACLVTLASLANINIVQMLGEPLNYRWLRYSDFFRGVDGRHAVFSWLSLASALVGAWAVGSLIGLAYLFRWSSRFVFRSISSRDLWFAAIPLLVAYFCIAPWYLITNAWSIKQTGNPIVAFISSVVTSYDQPGLFTTPTTVKPDDVMTVADRHETTSPTAGKMRDPAIRNVLMIVLESTAADYTDFWGGKNSPTPNLARYANRAAIFDSVYASAPSTKASFLSLLCSVYPAITYREVSDEHPAIQLDSLSALLKTSGYRTGYFSSSDASFQGGRTLLAHEQFQFVRDSHDGCAESLTTKSLLKWIDGAGDPAVQNTAFFAMLCTAQTRHPYMVVGQSQQLDRKDATWNKYLNALMQTDVAIGELLDALSRRGLLESTLIVVVADQGEAFGQHGEHGHGTALYDENVHVPCMLINPKLFHGEHYNGIGGLVDVAPTVCDILNLPQQPLWQGRNLFSRDPNGRAYFCAPWADYLFAYREANQFVVVKPIENRFEVYDLKTDAHQHADVSKGATQIIASAQNHLAAWVQYQTKFYDRQIKAAPPATKPAAAIAK